MNWDLVCFSGHRNQLVWYKICGACQADYVGTFCKCGSNIGEFRHRLIVEVAILEHGFQKTKFELLFDAREFPVCL